MLQILDENNGIEHSCRTRPRPTSNGNILHQGLYSFLLHQKIQANRHNILEVVTHAGIFLYFRMTVLGYLSSRATFGLLKTDAKFCATQLMN